MPTHYNLKADFTCAFCAKTKQYSAMLVGDKIEPSMMNAGIHEFYLDISAFPGKDKVGLTTPTGKCLVLICDECRNAIGATLSHLFKERRNASTG
jgi:hypothetical protein